MLTDESYIGECKEAMMAYMKCIKAHKSDTSHCRPESKAYLACRMDKGLMERVPWTDLGFPEEQQDSPGGGK